MSATNAGVVERPGLAERARRPVRAAWFGAMTAGMLAAFEVHRLAVPSREQDQLLDRYRKVYLRRTLNIFGVEIAVHPGVPERLPGSTARLVVSNHRSALDIGILLHLFGGNIVSRADISGWPIIGRVARNAGTIFVDREKGMSRAAAAMGVRRKLTDGGTVVIFPEGTTFPGDEVRNFQAGTFAALKGIEAEVVPVGLAYAPGTEFGDETFLEHLARTAGRRGTRVSVAVGEPFRPDGDARAVSNVSRERVQALVHDARARFTRA